jgi:lipoyl(octanoyl) transferase
MPFELAPLITAAFAATQRAMTSATASAITLPGDIELRVDIDPVPYREALDTMTARNTAIVEGTGQELIWLLDHQPVYTAGTSAAGAELLDPRFEVVKAGRGGRYTYHGPGQRIGYVLLDLKKRARDARGFVHALEGWVIATLADFGVESFRRDGRIGIWTIDIDGREAKIGAIGVRIRRWVTMHGFAVNLSPDLSHFAGIVPCGIAEFGVTSLARLGVEVDSAAWDRALLARAGDFLAALDVPCPPESAA